jgi:protein-L-isoaspartate(D-aspartate) O-methyltransferase
MPDYATQRLNMVEAQVRANDVNDPRIVAAMRKVARELYVPSAKRGIAYAEAAIEVVNGRFLLEPRTFAKLLLLADVGANDSVLDVGCLAGYSTAVLAELAKAVVGLEEDGELVRVASDALAGVANATLVQGGLAEGYGAKAPYNVIFINGAVETVPDPLLAQLAEGGRLVVVVRQGALNRATLYVREHGRIGHRAAFDASAPLLAGFKETVGFVF